MGLYDTVLLIDDVTGVSCPHGHRLRSFQTKDMHDPSLSTYLVHRNRLYLVLSGSSGFGFEDPSEWRIDGNEAVRAHRYELTEVVMRGPIRIYSYCECCEPILVRTDAANAFGDIVGEHVLLVDFRLSFRPSLPPEVERITGTRDDMRADLRARGLHVLADDEPLAVAHRELKRARETARRAGRRWV